MIKLNEMAKKKREMQPPRWKQKKRKWIRGQKEKSLHKIEYLISKSLTRYKGRNDEIQNYNTEFDFSIPRNPIEKLTTKVVMTPMMNQNLLNHQMFLTIKAEANPAKALPRSQT